MDRSADDTRRTTETSADLIREIYDLSEALTRRRAEAARDVGLEDGQAQVLEALGDAEPQRLTAGELSRRCGVTAGATTQRLSGLERLGLVERVREEPDRRTVHVALTAAGRARLGEVRERRVRADRELYAFLPEEDGADLRRIVGAWRRRLGPS